MDPPICERRPHIVILGNVEEGGERTAKGREGLLITPPMKHLDDLYWLRDDERKDEGVLAHLRAENAYADSKTEHLKAPAEQLYNEIRSRIKESDNSVPVKKGGYLYFKKTEEGKSYPAHCRRNADPSLGVEDVVYLDENVIADGHEMCDINSVVVSDHGDIVAYSTDFSGSEEYSINFVPAPAALQTTPCDANLPDVLVGTSGHLVWSHGSNDFVFYTTLDEAHRPYRVFKHAMGTDQAADLCIFEELDDQSWVHISRTTSDDYLVIRSTTKLTSYIVLHPLSPRAMSLAERSKPDISVMSPPIHFKRKSDEAAKEEEEQGRPTEQARVLHRLLILPKVDGVLYELDHLRGPSVSGEQDKLVILTNHDKASNFQIMHTPCMDPRLSNWTTLIPASDHIYITELEVHSSYLAFGGKDDGYENVWLVTAPELRRAVESTGPVSEGVAVHRVPPLDTVYVMSTGDNDEYETDCLRFTYCSPTCPDMVCELRLIEETRPPSTTVFSMAQFDYAASSPLGSIVVLKQRQVLNVDLSLYKTARIMATAPDGAVVPISLLFKPSAMQISTWDPASNTAPSRPCPLLLYGYGAYGISWDPTFSSSYLSVCDRGMVYAIAHIRGGGEMGRHWYLEGKLLNKRNTFSDFIACAEHLISTGWTQAGQIVAQGGSAGGLLVTVVANERPELFAGVLASVPFVDAIVTMADASIPLVSTEWDEWGCPNEVEAYEYIKAYSPIDNIKRQHYPRMLLEAGLSDYRVGYWEVAKYCQRLREKNTNFRETLFRCELDEGHTGAMDRYRYIRDIALEFSYILDCVNLLLTNPK